MFMRDIIIVSPTQSQTQLTAHKSTFTSVTTERDELAEEKSCLEEKLMVLQSQTHELQVCSMARVHKNRQTA